MTRATITVEGRRIELSNTDKVLFPEAGLTKGDLIDYYRRIAPVLLPHIAGRALSLQRYPDGVDAAGFFQKNVSAYFPEWLGRAELSKENGSVEHVVACDAPSLVYLANQACITLHVSLAPASQPHHPDRLVIDLDPSSRGFAPVKRTARRVRVLLEEVGLAPFLQTTGSRGLHIWVPLDQSAGFDEVKRFARDLARRLEGRHPDEITTQQRKRARGDRLFLDILRNAYGQTAVAPYSVRARARAPVATPLDWHELDDSKLASDRYTITSIFRRLARKPDPWAEMNDCARPLAPAAGRLRALKI